MTKLIITGGTGFIGTHLLMRLISHKPNSIVVITNSHDTNHKYLSDRKDLNNEALSFYTADIRDRKAISNIFQKERADICIHLAAKISVADSIRNPHETLDINANGTRNVLEACHDSEVGDFIFASSASVYGDVKELPIAENQMLRPLSPYGSSKMLAEQFIATYQKQNKVKNTISLRIFNVYGEGQASEADVITRFAKRLSSGQPPKIYGDGIQTRDFISVDDVVDAFLLSMKSLKSATNKEHTYPSVFNVGTGTPTSINDLAQKLIKLFALDLEPIYEVGGDGDSGILHSYADITKAKEILNFVPKKEIETGLKEMIRAINSRNEQNNI